jgi:hypothetical protein
MGICWPCVRTCLHHAIQRRLHGLRAVHLYAIITYGGSWHTASGADIFSSGDGFVTRGLGSVMRKQPHILQVVASRPPGNVLCCNSFVDKAYNRTSFGFIARASSQACPFLCQHFDCLLAGTHCDAKHDTSRSLYHYCTVTYMHRSLQ